MSELLLRQAQISDSRKIFDLRNHPQVRRYSHNINEIDFDVHQDWFEKALSDKSKHILIAQRESDFIGIVRFDLIGNDYLLSWSVSPEFQGRGFGKSMLCIASRTINGNFKAEIKKNNIASIKIAEFIGMKLTKQINDILYYQNDYQQ
jgi:spore coat polysaccharide biosynthesis protein SpsF